MKHLNKIGLTPYQQHNSVAGADSFSYGFFKAFGLA